MVVVLGAVVVVVVVVVVGLLGVVLGILVIIIGTGSVVVENIVAVVDGFEIGGLVASGWLIIGVELLDGNAGLEGRATYGGATFLEGLKLPLIVS